MSRAAAARPDGSRRRQAVQPWALVWLTLVWCLLWREVSVANVVGGALVALAAQLVFPLPAVRIGGRLRPVWMLVFLGRMAREMAVASVDVASQAVRPGHVPRSAVLEVDLDTDSDFVTTLVGIVVSLVPGSIVVEARRSTHTLFLHVLDAADEAAVEKERRRVHHLERSLVRALGEPMSGSGEEAT